MDEASLRSLISSLYGRLSSLESWSHFWTAIVILGCALEAIFVIREYWKDRNEWVEAQNTGIVAPPSKPSVAWLICEFLGVLFVVTGISGELSIDRKVGEVQTRLRDANEKLVLIFEQKAGDAVLSANGAAGDAKLAKDSAGAANLLAKGARKEADSFETDIVAAKSKAADAESHLADALHRVTVEEKEEAQLELLVGPRRLTLNEQDQIGKACTGTIGDKITVSSYGMDAEGKALATQVAYAIVDHVISVNLDRNGPITTGELNEGVLITGPPEKEKFLQCLAAALTNEGKLKEVKVNPDRHVGNAIMSGAAVQSGAAVMSGGSHIVTGALPAGSPMTILVGVKPVELLQLKK